MRLIKCYGSEEISIEEFVKMEICKNNGTQSIAFKGDLEQCCEEQGIKLEKKKSKDELFDLLVEHGVTHEQLAERFSVGVSSQVYQDSFRISHQDVKRLERLGVLKKVGTYRFRAYGKYCYAPLYDVYQYANMTNADMEELLQQYPKGARNARKR